MSQRKMDHLEKCRLEFTKQSHTNHQQQFKKGTILCKWCRQMVQESTAEESQDIVV